MCWGFVAAGGLYRVAASRGYSLVAARGLLIAMAYLVAEHRLSGTWLSSCGLWVPELGLGSCGAQA